MRIKVISNAGSHLYDLEMSCLPMPGHYVKLGEDIYEVWRIIHIDSETRIQLSNKISPSASNQNNLFFK